MAAEYYLGVFDYIVIVLTLLISSAIGIKFKSRNQESGQMREYFMAGKNMPLLPVIMSAVATMISPLTIIGIPAESYRYGIQLWIMGFGMLISMILASHVFMPIYFQCGVCTVYEYLEIRFGRPTRYFISVMYSLQTVLWMGSVLYSPIIAMNVVTDLPVEPSIIMFGIICSIYSAFGGPKAVLWTDVFQISLMFITTLMVYITGIIDGGGIANVINRAKEGGRLNMFNFQVDFVTRYTFWNSLLQGLLAGVSAFGVNQTGVQRFLSLRNPKRAKLALLISNPLLSFMIMSACLHGIILYAVYFMCDPILNRRQTGLSKYDQIVPYFLVSKFHSIPGLTGLSVAGIFSGSLTSISSILNSLATVTVIDFVQPIFPSFQQNEKKSVALAKGLCLAYGIICICIALALTKTSSISQVGYLIHNTFEGPTMAIFAISVLTKKGFGKRILCGLLPGFLVTQWIGFNSLFSGYIESPLPLHSSMCPSIANSTYDPSTIKISNFISTSTTVLPSSNRILPPEAVITDSRRLTRLVKHSTENDENIVLQKLRSDEKI